MWGVVSTVFSIISLIASIIALYFLNGKIKGDSVQTLRKVKFIYIF
ncbi:putative membrane protein [Paenibacillus sp. 4624]